MTAFLNWLRSLFSKPSSPAVPAPKPQPVTPTNSGTSNSSGDASAPPVVNSTSPIQSSPTAPVGPRRINAEGMALVEQFEGLDLHAYLDSVKVPTIAWGRIQYDDGSKVKMGDTCTRAQADQWLMEDLEKDGAQWVRKLVPHALNDDQYAALVSFTYNRGSGRLHQLLAMGSDLDSVAKNLLHFDYAGSETNHLLGLERRRRAEQALFRSQPWRAFVSWRP